MNDISIKDFIITPEPIIVKSISINVMSMIFNKSVTLQVYMYSKTNENIKVMVDQKTILVEGDEYTAWGNNDTYLENLVFSKLGLQKADEVQVINESVTTNEQ